MARVEDDFEPTLAQLIPGILRRRESRSIGRSLGAVPSECGLPHGKVGESKEQEARHNGDVDGKRLPRVTSSTKHR